MRSGSARSEKKTKELSRENKRLKAELRRLRRENEKLRRSSKSIRDEESGNALWQGEKKKIALINCRNYISYVILSLKSTSFWSLYMRILSYFRRFRLFSLLLKGATRIVLWAESGVALLASFSAALILLPFFILISLVCFVFTLVRSRSANKYFSKALKGRKLYILTPTKKQLSEKDGFFCRNIKELSDCGSVCLVISPYFFGKKGLYGKDFYVTARKECDGAFLVRKYYYFMLFRRVISRIETENVIIF